MALNTKILPTTIFPNLLEKLPIFYGDTSIKNLNFSQIMEKFPIIFRRMNFLLKILGDIPDIFYNGCELKSIQVNSTKFKSTLLNLTKFNITQNLKSIENIFENLIVILVTSHSLIMR